MDLNQVVATIGMLRTLQQQQQQQQSQYVPMEEADVQDWQNLRQELVAAVGGLEQLNKQLAENTALVREWQEVQDTIAGQLQHISKKLDQVGDDVGKVLQFVEQIKTYIRTGRKSYKPKLLLSASDVKIHGGARLDEGTFAEVYSGAWDGTDVAVKQFKMLGIRQEQADEVRIGKRCSGG